MITGKTYSLQDNTGSDSYYKLIKNLTGRCLQHCPDEKILLAHLQKASQKKSFFSKFSGSSGDSSIPPLIKEILKDSLSTYTTGVKDHLKSLSIFNRLDRTLRTTEEQYHLYMIEVELVNRIYIQAFKRCEYKIALLPHCLRDFRDYRPNCRAVPGEGGDICKGCTRECFIHLGSTLLRRYQITPFIPTTIDFVPLFKRLKAEHPNLGILGIACIPELVMGIRLCMKFAIPAVGIPLDANRCARWLGQTHENSFNLQALDELLNCASGRNESW